MFSRMAMRQGGTVFTPKSFNSMHPAHLPTKKFRSKLLSVDVASEWNNIGTLIHCLLCCALCVCSEFVVSIMSDWFIEAANHTCGSFPPEVDEMALTGLTPAKSTIVSPPRVKESAVNMECQVRDGFSQPFSAELSCNSSHIDQRSQSNCFHLS